ncbi:MAG: hypothetical protein AAGJ92_13180, partial [Pseudomonadota bacterium]
MSNDHRSWKDDLFARRARRPHPPTGHLKVWRLIFRARPPLVAIRTQRGPFRWQDRLVFLEPIRLSCLMDRSTLTNRVRCQLARSEKRQWHQFP